MTRSLDALIPAYGCKRQLAPAIIDALGEHTAYWEPFCCSCAVLLAKPPCRMEVINDLYGDVVNLARVVADDQLGPHLFERLTLTAFSQELYRWSLAWMETVSLTEKTAMPMDWAYHFFVGSWMGRNGFAATTCKPGFCVRYTSNGGDPATRFKNAVERIPSWWKRLRGVTILKEHALVLLARIEDKEGTAIYCDPPYLQKQATYIHDFTEEDHRHLAEALRRFGKTRVVVSYYDHPALAGLYPTALWEKRPLLVQKNLSVQGAKERAPEVLLVNRTVTER